MIKAQFFKNRCRHSSSQENASALVPREGRECFEILNSIRREDDISIPLLIGNDTFIMRSVQAHLITVVWGKSGIVCQGLHDTVCFRRSCVLACDRYYPMSCIFCFAKRWPRTISSVFSIERFWSCSLIMSMEEAYLRFSNSFQSLQRLPRDWQVKSIVPNALVNLQ